MIKNTLTKAIFDKLEIQPNKIKDLGLQKPLILKEEQGKYEIIGEHYYQMDLMEMPSFNKYKYILCIINMRTRITDVEAMRSKDSIEVLKSFKKILERKIISFPEIIFMDNGSEFKNKHFIDYCNSNKIDLRWTRAGNHKQNAIVENINGKYKKYLNLYLSVKSLEMNKYFLNWIPVLPIIRDQINEYNKTIYPKKIDYLPPDVAPYSKVPIYEIGEEVHYHLDHPKALLSNKKLHGNFRHGDRHFSDDKKEIENIKIDQRTGIVRYILKNMFGSFLEKQLLKKLN